MTRSDSYNPTKARAVVPLHAITAIVPMTAIAGTRRKSAANVKPVRIASSGNSAAKKRKPTIQSPTTEAYTVTASAVSSTMNGRRSS
jgi:hypothetical protein